MEPAQLLGLAREFVGVVAPLVAGGALAKIGENTTDTGVQALGRAWGLLQRRFRSQRKAESALTIFEDEATKPESQERVVQQIVAVFQSDPAAIAELRALVEELKRVAPPAPSRSHMQQISGNAQVGTAISGDVHGNVTNIRGNVTGPVLSGGFSGPVTIGDTNVRNVNTGGGDYAEGNIDKSRRVIVGAAPEGRTAPSSTSSRTGRGELPKTLSADGVHFSYGHALLIGVGAYATTLNSAPTTANDALRLSELLRDSQFAAYPSDQITLLQNTTATKDGILAALDALAERLKTCQTPQRPTVVLFFAGHGVRRDGTFYLLPHDYTSSDVAVSAISARQFRQKVQAIAAQSQKLLVLINCCYAGGAAGKLLSDTAGAPQTDAPSRDFISTLVQGGGQVVISSSRSEQPSSAEAEDDFTLTTFGSKLLRGLRGAAPGAGPAVGVLDLFAHLAATVPADARGIALDQHPLLFAHEVDQNFPVALRPVGQAGGTLDVDQADAVLRLAELEIALFAYERDADAPELARERDELLRKIRA